MHKILITTTSIANLLKNLLNKKVWVNLFALVFISASATSAFAVTIKNDNTSKITYQIFTDAFTRLCESGQLEPGKSLKWEKSSNCSEQPQHVEVRVQGTSPIGVNCTPKGSHNPRVDNIGTIATVTSTWYGIHCVTTK